MDVTLKHVKLCNMNVYWYFLNALFSDVYIIIPNTSTPHVINFYFKINFLRPYTVMESQSKIKFATFI
jgi:hypothetical protein